MKKRYKGALVVAVGLALLSPIGWAEAGHLDTITAHCTYEVGELEPNIPEVGPFSIDYAIDDPTNLTRDGSINDTVCAFHTPDSDPGENSDLGPFHFALSGVTTIDGQYSQAQASIVDDIFADAVGGAMCADFNHDHLCGSGDEPAIRFCGTSPTIMVGQDTDGDTRNHADFGWGLVVGVNGYVGQALFCNPDQAPTSTSGGVLDPAGGIRVTVTG